MSEYNDLWNSSQHAMCVDCPLTDKIVDLSEYEAEKTMGHDEDRRINRTRQLLRDAFLILLKKKRYEDISVQDIIEQANVARSTFYVHYTDKKDLLVGKSGVFAGNVGHHTELIHYEEKDRATLFSMRIWFQHIQGQKDILKIIAKDLATDLAMKNLFEILRNDIQTRVEKHFSEQFSIPISLVVDYMTSSLMALITWWVKADMAYSPEQMDEMFQQLVMPGVLSIVKHRN